MTEPGLNNKRALDLLSEYGCSEHVIKHAKAVSQLAAEIAAKIKNAGGNVDLVFVETAALLHDIGRCKTNGIGHGLAGAEILSDHPRYARVCRTHVGAGLTREEAEKAGLAPADYLPETVEEKIIAHADNLIDGDRRQSLDDAIAEFARKLGPKHPSVERVRRLGAEIESLTGA